ncbi:MAG: hypothetical protein C0482_15015 [Gordonia sp.]|jgi:hypothetical protein|nr:hypothetical protein [Gordonia sp. (in: high G+C Gram-positive bacteria)]OZG29346.1 hypothetical protein BH683_009155 [Williamsia sp. 1138]
MFASTISDMEFLYVLIPAFIGVFMVFKENAKKTAHLPRAPFGADAEYGLEEWRRWAEIEEQDRRRKAEMSVRRPGTP